MPVVSSFAGSSLLHQGGGYEPQRKSNFSVVFYGVGDTDTLVLSLKSSSVPAIKMVRKGVKYFNETMHYAGSVSPFDEQTIVYRDFLDRAVCKTLWEWYNYVWCPESGAIGMAAAYKRKGDIYMLPPGGGGGQCPGSVSATDGRKKWHLEGCWPTSMSYSDFDHEDDGSPAEISMSISIDRAYPTF
jgi:hypothetical protein